MLKNNEYPPETQTPGDISAFALAVKKELDFNGSTLLKKLKVSSLSIEIHRCSDSIWMAASANEKDCVALRLCYHPGEITSVKVSGNTINVKTPSGIFNIKMDFDEEKTILHYTTSIKPGENLKIPYYPRDVYPLNRKGKRITSEGNVYAQQRGPKGGFLFFSLTKPVSGTYLYMQDFTSLNKYFSYSKTSPENTVGGRWPEMGFALPSSNGNYIPKGKEVIISDAYITYTEEIPSADTEAGKLFLNLLWNIYPRLRKPRTEYVDWIAYASRTVSSLQSKSAIRKINNRYYLNAYNAADYLPPESMVQLSIHVPAMEYEHWKRKKISVKEKIDNNISSFYNKDIKTIVKWLPGVSFNGRSSKEHSHTKMDSWYLYHTLMNYGRLAQLGNKEARKLFIDSLGYAMKVARHFDYRWPVFYNVKTLEVIHEEPLPGGLAEVDIGGLYCRVMMLGYRMTKNEIYLEESKTAINKMKSLGFGRVYQTNTTLLGAAAMAELYNATADEHYLEMSILSIANVIFNAWLWECNYGYGKNYSTFFGLPPIHDAPYIACYEETESLGALLYYLTIIRNRLPESVIMLCSEYMRHLLYRGKYYFPYNLPENGISEKPKEGIINKKLTLPLEDINEGWKQSGQVGQEVYGAATSFVAVTCAYKNFKDIPFIIYCNYPVLTFTYNNEKGNSSGEIKFEIEGSSLFRCEVRIIKREKSLGKFNIRCFSNGRKISPTTEDKHLRFLSRGKNYIKIKWAYK